MKETIKFLDVLDIQRKKNKTFSQISNKNSQLKSNNQSFIQPNQNKYRSLLPLSTRRFNQTNNSSRIFQDNQKSKTYSINQHRKQKNQKKNQERFRFFKALNFDDHKFDQYPNWLKDRQDFTAFMYKNYQKKLLTIPIICQKDPKDRASDQKYFVSLYLQQLQIFENVPQVIMENILKQIKTKNYKAGQIVHEETQDMEFMGVIFVGSVEYKKSNKIQRKQRNQIIMKDAFYRKYHPTIIAKQQTIILCIHKDIYKTLQELLKQDLYDKNRGEISDLMKSDFFVQLHLKQKRAKQFYDDLTPEFYFKDSIICEAGQQANKFYIHFKGQVVECNHIYIRQHNKWPLPHKRWQVRAVYNSYQNQNILKPFSFFADEQITNNHNFKSSYHAKTFTYLYSMQAHQFKSSLNGQDLKRLKKYRNQHLSVNYSQFQNQIRKKLRSQIQNQSIARKAIATSFSKKSSISQKKSSFLSNIEKSMIQNIKQQETLNDHKQKSKTFFK